MSNIKLYKDDCLNVLKTLDDNSVDLIVTDPPYRVTSRGGCNTMGGHFKQGSLTNRGKIFEHNDISPEEYLPQFYRVLKDKTACYVMCNNLNLQEMLNVATDCGFHFIKSLIWEKNLKICGTYYMGCFEYILMFRKGSYQKINFCGTPDLLNIPIEKLKDENGNNIHDTEKPIALMRTLITNSSNRGDLVLDPFMGIGSTIIASKLDGRDAIGIEMDEKYFTVAKARIDETVESINFFD